MRAPRSPREWLAPLKRQIAELARRAAELARRAAELARQIAEGAGRVVELAGPVGAMIGSGSDRRLRLVLAGIVGPLVVLTAVAVGVLWPHSARGDQPAASTTYVPGHVVTIQEQACSASQLAAAQAAAVAAGSAAPAARCGTVQVRLIGGPDAGMTITTQIPSGPGAPEIHTGDNVLLFEGIDPANSADHTYYITDHQRGHQLLVLALVFAAATIAFGRWRGLAALGGLAISFVVLLLFVVPSILNGRDPVLIAIVGCAAIMFAVLYLTHGISVNTTVAVLGTLASLVVTGVAATLAATATTLTGYTDESSYDLNLYFGTLDLRGLLLAGIIIGSLGVLDDVTVTQAVTVSELHAANPGLSRFALFRSAARVGRAHIASVVNTLVLAYAGASLPLLLLIYAGGSRVGTVLTSQLAAQEIVRSIVGSLGLIAAVPITTALAAALTAPALAPGAAPAPAPAADPAASVAARRPRPAADPDGAALLAGRDAITAPWRDENGPHHRG